MSRFSHFERSWLSILFFINLGCFHSLYWRRLDLNERFHFFYNPVPAARMFSGFASSCEAKSASTSEAPSPSHSERAAYTFFHNPVPVARTVGRFTPSCEAKSASSSGLPTPSCSEQATCTFYSNSNTPAAPIPPPIHIVTIPNCWLRRFIS